MVRHGYTLVEILLVIAIFGFIASFVTLNLTTVRNDNSLESVVMQLRSDIRKQQSRVMSGNSGSLYTGVYLTSTSYVLFDGSSYSSSDPTNYTVTLPADVTISTITLPSNQIIFSKPSGEVAGYSTSNSSFVVSSTGGGFSKTFSLNFLGVLNVN
jgi:prepilin-type N-terminal cleavage/methylation domain-containing protein